MAKNKLFTFTYRAEIKRAATVEARNEEEAREKIDAGDFEDEYDIDFLDIDDICFIEEEDV